MLYTALISLHHCSNEINIEKFESINIRSNYVSANLSITGQRWPPFKTCSISLTR